MKKTILVIFIAVTALTLVLALPTIAQNVACFTQQGGANVVAGSGCTYSFQSGSTLDIQAGATAVIPSGVLGQNAILRYPTPNTAINCKTNTITDTASYTATVTAISTPQFALCSLNAITGDAEKCAAAVGSGIVTVTVRNAAATPAANGTGAVVYWCAGGTPQ